jgi:uncharacterized protein YbjT (DUF2867 family)
MLLLVGATGKIGRHVLRELTARGERPRVLVRDLALARTRLGDDAEYVRADLADPATLPPALDGVDAAYLAVGHSDRTVELETGFLAAAEAAGLSRLVKISAIDAGPDSPSPYGRWHAEIEKRIAASPIATTLVRANILTDNLLYSIPSIRTGQLLSSAEDSTLGWVDAVDVAAVAAAALLGCGRTDGPVVVTGPEAITYDELARRLTAGLGRPVEHLRIDDAAYRAALTAVGLPAWLVQAQVEMYRGVRDGVLSEVTDTVALTLGRPARKVDDWIAVNAAAFAPTSLSGPW